jgi:hypothetical protein
MQRHENLNHSLSDIVRVHPYWVGVAFCFVSRTKNFKVALPHVLKNRAVHLSPRLLRGSTIDTVLIKTPWRYICRYMVITVTKFPHWKRWTHTKKISIQILIWQEQVFALWLSEAWKLYVENVKSRTPVFGGGVGLTSAFFGWALLNKKLTALVIWKQSQGDFKTHSPWQQASKYLMPTCSHMRSYVVAKFCFQLCGSALGRARSQKCVFFGQW